MEILVYADWFELKGPTRLGTLSVTHVKEREVFSFAYDKDWLSKGQAQVLDPDLQLFQGRNILLRKKRISGSFWIHHPNAGDISS